MSQANLLTAKRVYVRWGTLAQSAAQRHALDPDVVLAVIAQESAR